MNDLRRTKILATLGPATDAPGVLDDLVRAGVNVVRLNFSHGTPADHEARINAVRGARSFRSAPAGSSALPSPILKRGMSIPVSFSTLAIASASSGVTSVKARPLAPARPVRPIRCT